MILHLHHNASQDDIQTLKRALDFMRLTTRPVTTTAGEALLITSPIDERIQSERFKTFAAVATVCSEKKLKLASKSTAHPRSVFDIKGHRVGGESLSLIAGPCAIESERQIHTIAQAVKQAGATILRGGAFKPRTSPYDFQGLGESGLAYLQAAAQANDMLCISEVMSPEDLPLVSRYVDILQIGARNMQNYALLKAVGKAQRPVLLKRGLSATYQEFLSAAEYILSAGNAQVILCERGIRTFETHTRNTLDLAAVPVLRSLTHLPIFVDPSHGVGLRSAVPTLANAAVAGEADGLMIEVHTDPDASVSDAAQTISTETFTHMVPRLQALKKAIQAPRADLVLV